jgi:hypothetical protein
VLKSIDPGQKCGWSQWDGDRLTFGVFDLKGLSGEGASFHRSTVRMREFIQRGDVIGLEAPVKVNYSSIQSQQFLLGLRAVILSTSFACGARVIEIEPSTWRSKILGVTMAPKLIKGTDVRRAWIKRKAVEHCRARGYGETTDDEADALCILEYLRLRIDPTFQSDIPLMEVAGVQAEPNASGLRDEAQFADAGKHRRRSKKRLAPAGQKG